MEAKGAESGLLCFVRFRWFSGLETGPWVGRAINSEVTGKGGAGSRLRLSPEKQVSPLRLRLRSRGQVSRGKGVEGALKVERERFAADLYLNG